MSTPNTLWAFKKTAFYKAIMEVVKQVVPQNKETTLALLELGCGPGRLAIRIKTAYPRCSITAVDRDPEILRLARENAEKTGVKIEFVEHDLAQLDLQGKFDRIYSTFVFHHLTEESKRLTLEHVKQGLKPSGCFIIADFSESRGWKDRLKFLIVQLVDGFTTTTPHRLEWLEQNLRHYFSHIEERDKISTFLGPVSVFVCS